MKRISEDLFNNKYLPIIKQMYIIGFNDGMANRLENLLYAKNIKNKM